MPRPKISATVLSLNEERKIGRCLATLTWVDEVLVLDAGSKDATVEIARLAGARVVTQEWLGFARQKEHAASLATHDWVLNVDADERVGRDVVEAVARTGFRDVAGFRVRRVNDFLGAAHRPVHRPREERLVRLYDRRHGSWGRDLVHETVTVRGPVADLAGTLYHEGFRSLEEAADRINRYSTLLARQRGPLTPSTFGTIVKPVSRLVWALVRRGAIRDGPRGVALAATWAYHDLLVAVKRMEPALLNDPVFADELLALWPPVD